MTLRNNEPIKDHAAGLRHCLERIRAAADAGRVICAEKKWRWTGLVLAVIGWAAERCERQ